MLLENKDTVFFKIGKTVGYAANLLFASLILTLIFGTSWLFDFNAYASFTAIVAALAVIGKLLRKYLRW